MNEMIGRGNMSVASASDETKKIAEVQGKMVLARKFPRDINYAMQMIEAECQSLDLAEKAVYEFPRGDSVVRGASIRLVECVSRHWGNLISGVEELSSTENSATVRAYCWDLQTNFSDEKVFGVSYMRSTKKGNHLLTDPRDRYEKMANEGARRKRACIQAVIPKFVIDKAMEICQQTLSDSMKSEDLEKTKEKMLSAFNAVCEWITETELSSVCGKDWDKLGTRDIVKLRNLYNAIKDGFVKPEAAFGREEAKKPSEAETNRLDDLNNLIKDTIASAKDGTKEVSDGTDER